jgi:alkylation response protein AidB-like acyl-CoA dehydrogenase
MEQSTVGVRKEIDRATRHPPEVLAVSISFMPANFPRLAKMIAHCESNQAWLVNITYQMTLMPYKQQSAHLAGPIGLLKMFATRSAHEIADDAVQVFGGRELTQTGMGKTIEIFRRTYKFDAILGGAEGIYYFPCDGARLIILQRFSVIWV